MMSCFLFIFQPLVPRPRNMCPWKRSLLPVDFPVSNPSCLPSINSSLGGDWIWKWRQNIRRTSAEHQQSCQCRLTFIWTSGKNDHLKKSVTNMGAVLTDMWLEAEVHVVEDVASPGQRASWSSRLGGHLLVTPRLAMGPWIQHLAKTKTQ